MEGAQWKEQMIWLKTHYMPVWNSEINQKKQKIK